MSVLIEGLPDAVVIRCFARVPFYLHPKLEVVSRSWREAIHSSELFKARQELNSYEDLLCVCAVDPENLWQLYDPLRDLWITLPFLPSKVKQLGHFGVVSISGKVFVLGGRNDAVYLLDDHGGSFATNEVWSYDPVIRNWTERAPMLVPRAMFACCVSGGKIVAAGGFTSCQKFISKAEIYDPEKDVWAPLPDLNHAHNTACSGITIDGKVHVLHKGSTTVQILDSLKHEWTVHEYDWLHGPMAVVQGSLYVMSFVGLLLKQDKEAKWFVVSASAFAYASEFRNRIGFAMVGLGDDVYVIGGETRADGSNWESRKLSDVHVLTIGNKRPVWRQVANMTKCKGTIFGCTNLRI